MQNITCKIYPQYGYEYVTLSDYFLRTVYHRYLICKVFPMYGYAHGTSSFSCELCRANITLVRLLPRMDANM